MDGPKQSKQNNGTSGSESLEGIFLHSFQEKEVYIDSPHFYLAGPMGTLVERNMDEVIHLHCIRALWARNFVSGRGMEQ